MNYRETSAPGSAYCPECDEAVSADMYSPFDDRCESCQMDKEEDEELEAAQESK